MADMKAELQGEIDDDVEVEKLRAEGQEAAIRQEMATEAQRVDQKIADDIAAESALRVAEEQRIEGKVDAEAQRADAEEKRIVGLVEAEAEAARAAELKLTQDLAKEVEDRGKAVQDLSDKHDREMEAAANKVTEDLTALKTELQGEIDADVAAEAKLRKEADEALDERVKPLEAHVAAQPGVDAEQDRRIKALEDDVPVKQAAIEAAQAAADAAQADIDAVEKRLDDEGGLVDRIEANEANIARLDGAVDVEGSVKKQIKDAVDALNADAEVLEARVKANEDDIVDMKAEEAKIREDFVKADEEVLAAAKKHADDAITDLVDSAPDAMNTLNELAKAINDNKGIYDAWVVEHNQAMANMKEELQGEIDADVKVVADELAKQKDAEQVGTLANQIKVEKGRAEGVEAAIRGEMEVEAARVDKKIADDIKTEHDLRVAEEQRIEQECEAAMAQEVIDRNAAILVEQQRAEGKEGELLAAINKEVQDRESAVSGEASARQQADEAIGGRLDKLEAKVDVDGKSVADQIADLKSDLEGQMEAAAEAQLQKDNDQDKALTDAIAQEVEDRNAAIKLVNDELEKQKDPAQEGTLAKQIADEIVRAKAEEADIRADFAAEDQKLQAAIDLMKNADVEGTLASLIAALRSDLTAHLTTKPFDGDQKYDDLGPLS